MASVFVLWQLCTSKQTKERATDAEDDKEDCEENKAGRSTLIMTATIKERQATIKQEQN
jgi:late competence protein required for DNA uptake (superfamily II DNA/RNA helicase)